MFRATLTILVLLGYAASQLAMLPHAHCELQPHSSNSTHQQSHHQQTPHLHLNWFSWGTQTAALHEHHASHHDPADTPDSQPCDSNEQHDDVVYFPLLISSFAQAKQVDSTNSVDQLTNWLLVDQGHRPDLLVRAVRIDVVPPEQVAGCAQRFLRFQNFRL